jgi:hypothetical protein
MDPYAWMYNLPASHAPPLAIYLRLFVIPFGDPSIKVFVMANHDLSVLWEAVGPASVAQRIKLDQCAAASAECNVADDNWREWQF